ncbi:putative protein OS=Streptomyces microflavus OX=1919 GN=Smic_05650 PE=4 SV=1 [Streptomyces microflavus]
MDTPDAFPEPLPGADGAGAQGPAADDGTPPGRRLIRCPLQPPPTGADSRRTGLGPAPATAGCRAPPDIRTRRHEVEQDPLPGT